MEGAVVARPTSSDDTVLNTVPIVSPMLVRCMAPPKRKTGGGRVTPKGTRPEDRQPTTPTDRHSTPAGAHEVAASSRYTPKETRRELVPPSWIPVIMLALLIIGGLLIMARYLVFTDTNIPTLIGLVCILGGLYTATKWR
jgi:hypothetical protein